MIYLNQEVRPVPFIRRLSAYAAATICTTGVLFTVQSTPHAHAQPYKIGSTGFPSAIRVAIRQTNAFGEPDPRGAILFVQTVNFDTYCREVLPNEWYPSWPASSLQAGAVAVKMFGWYHHLHPVTVGGFTFDVDNTVNFQTFREQSEQGSTDQAYYATRPLAYVPPTMDIQELNYRAGYQGSPNWQYRNAQKMAQWGSDYLALQGWTPTQILNFYYAGRQVVNIPGVGAVTTATRHPGQQSVPTAVSAAPGGLGSGNPPSGGGSYVPTVPGHMHGRLRVKAMDGRTHKPLAGAEVVVLETEKRYRTDAEGLTQWIDAPVLRSARYRFLVNELHGQLTLISYKNGYQDSIHMGVRVNEKSDTKVTIWQYRIIPGPDSRIEPVLYQEPYHRLWLIQLADRFRRPSQLGEGYEHP